ncbi:MAG: histidinol phosphate phosphatase [Flavipsychrobacter sp.]|nr:histidinol phosphate phosphatase [Flavipsychrobacter sp.]
MEAIILAGGLGTRLQGVIGSYPKCMAEVNGQPFLAHLFEYLDRQKCTRVILSLGYKSRIVTDWLEELDYLPFEVDCVIEDEPLGTGGGILAAIEEAEADDVAILNGDTMFLVDLKDKFKFHISNKAATTLALKEMHEFDRYGVVHTNDKGLITSFEEKKYQQKGLINGGVYIVNKEAFINKPFSEKFSFEKDYLEQFLGEKKFYGYKSEGYFIDIGIPVDFGRAQDDFKSLFL